MPVIYVSKRCYGTQYLSKHPVSGAAKRDVNVSEKNPMGHDGQSGFVSVLTPLGIGCSEAGSA